MKQKTSISFINSDIAKVVQKKRDAFFYIVNAVATDGLATQEDISLAVMILTYCSKRIAVAVTGTFKYLDFQDSLGV